MAEEQQKREDENNEIKEMGTLNMKESGSKYGIQLLTIIGEIEKQQCKKYRTCGGNYDTCYIDSVHSAFRFRSRLFL